MHSRNVSRKMILKYSIKIFTNNYPRNLEKARRDKLAGYEKERGDLLGVINDDVYFYVSI